MKCKTIIFKKTANIATITLNRPQKYNAINADMLSELLWSIDEVNQDDEIRVLIITGKGQAFCTGADISIFENLIKDKSWEMQPLKYKARFAETWYAFILQFCNIAKPVIAAVNGVAAGGGLVLAAAADIRIASVNAGFSQLFARRGLPDGGSTFFLPKMVGIGKACELAFTGDIIDAKEAERIGLVNKVVPDEMLHKTAIDLAENIANGPPITLQLIKKALYRGLVATDLASHVEYEFNSLLIGIANEDFKEGVRSFLEKRAPKFKGR